MGLKPILDFLGRDDPDELGEGDLGGVAFGEGSGCEPLATGGNPLPQLGVARGEAVEKETVGTNHRLRRDGSFISNCSFFRVCLLKRRQSSYRRSWRGTRG